MMMKRFLCFVTALAMLLSAVALAEPAAAPMPEGSTAYYHNGRVTLIDGNCAGEPLTGFEDAAWVVECVLDQLGGDENTRLDPWRELTDAFGNRYYVFQQMYNGTTVLGGAVKVITDPEGNMIGLTSSIEDNPAGEAVADAITAGKAERIVLDHALETRQQTLALQEGMTKRMILPVALEVDIEDEDSEGSRYVWVVYTDNPDSSVDRASDLPYLAHYVTLSGEYLYSLPTIMPGDEAAESGFDSSYVFEFMEPADYTGYVDLSTGGELEISVTVMRDRRTGMYYLGDLERRIVVADCWEFLYGGGRVVLESSKDNLEWDQVGLLTFYNYCRAYDYYREIGWIGSDGLGTPILVLNDFCDINRAPVDNAAYAGGYLGWQVFLASKGNDFAQCLDVLAHEFTHCVTGSVMTYNAYQNDFGAINEAVSDIQGKTCQLLMDGPEGFSWNIGDHSVMPVRSMDDPHRFSQPEFTWDVYYNPRVRTPTGMNDRGGVHTNSSLLNTLAWRLYESGGMTPEEGRAFWFTVDCAMVPGTDYAQLAEILPWAMRATGLEKYASELQRALDATRLGVEDIPVSFDEDRALLTLSLPEGELFEDEQWAMQVFCVNAEKLIEGVTRIATSVMAGDTSVLPQFVQEMLNAAEAEAAAEPAPEADKGLIGSLLDALLTADEPAGEDEPAEALPEAAGEESQFDFSRLRQELTDWMREHMEGAFYTASTNAGQDGRTMRMVCLPGHAVPVLMHARVNGATGSFEDFNILAYVGDRWIDVGALFSLEEQPEGGEGEMPEAIQDILNRLVEGLTDFDSIHSVDDVLDLLFYPIRGGEENVLPADGLDAIEPVVIEIAEENAEDSSAERRSTMSRPKLEEVPDAA